MIPNLLGNIADWKRINKIAKKYKLKVIEDSADNKFNNNEQFKQR
jgi:dTDP-4-amino-4,6-dideoxygalactose transaminase